MEERVLTLPDGSQKRVPPGTTGRAVAEGIGKRLAKAALAVKLDDQVLDLDRPLPHGGRFAVLTWNDREGREVFRHSSTHLMAQAVKRLYPEAKLATGPALEDGFYYDIDFPQPISEAQLTDIERVMAEIVREDLPIVREEWPRDEARRFFHERGEHYKVQIIDDLPEEATVSLYRQGEFIDLCRGPHLPSTGKIKAFKLLNIAGAYFRGDENNPMLQRVYGTSFETQEALDHYLWQREEAKRRDHRKLGRELDLYSFREEAPGFPFWHAKGVAVYRALENFSRQLQERRGYQEVATPWIASSSLWETSGHWAHYRDNMFVTENEERLFAVKPMNCPFHCLLYKNEVRSYRDLPLKIAEYGPLSRCERSGALHGLLRVRGFHQDDAHLFIREDQIEEQIREVIGLVDEIYGTFGMPYTIKLSTRPDDFMGDVAVWDRAEAALARALEGMGRAYVLNPGDGAFYGPKLDFDVTDALGRQWQCSTVQLDFQLPIKFDLTFKDADGQDKRPVMIHRAIMGSLERFLGILVEHYAGAFPTWLAPVQVKVLSIVDRHVPYAETVLAALQKAGLRAEIDARNEKIGFKIRQAQVEKVPYMLVVGDRECEDGSVAVRSRQGGDLGAQSLASFLARVTDEVANRRS